MKGKLRKEFIERMEAILDGDIVVEEVEELIHVFCDKIENRLLDVCAELKRIKGSREIDHGEKGDREHRGTVGRQISEITGPTRDLLVDLLSPLAN